MRILSIVNVRKAVIASTQPPVLIPQTMHTQVPPTRSQVDSPFAFQFGFVHFAPGRYMLSEPRENILSAIAPTL